MNVRLQTAANLAMRGAALFLGAFTIVGVVGELRGRTLDASLWWIDLGDLPSVARLLVLTTFAGSLGAWALAVAPGRRLRRTTGVASAVLAVFAGRDVVGFYQAVGAGNVRPLFGIPLSVLIAILLAGLAMAAIRVRPTGVTGDQGWRAPVVVGRARDVVALAVTAGAWAVAFALAQMLFFGTTDYRRPADAAMVFGARVYATGQPSPLLADRIRTGVDLYAAGLVPLLVMSGGDGSDGFNEARVMRDVAVAAGVEPAAVIVDPAGNSTEATVANVSALLAARRSGDGAAGPRLVIAVSQAYHLPRVQLAFANAGIDVLTVPAADPEPIGEMPILIAREVAAFWAYYLRACLG